MAWAIKRAIPIAPPNSGPSAREIRKYAPPPDTGVFVDTADIDRVVRVVMALAMIRIRSAWKIPASPITLPARMNMMTPRIVSMDGVKTPPNVPSLF